MSNISNKTSRDYRLQRYLGWLSNTDNHMFHLDRNNIEARSISRALTLKHIDWVSSQYKEITPYSDDEYYGMCCFGDIKHEMFFPGLARTRPIKRNNSQIKNIIAFPNINRQWTPVQRIQKGEIKDIPWSEKQNKMIWRGALTNDFCKNNPRLLAVRRYHSHELIDVGLTKGFWMSKINPKYERPKMSIDEQLTYKYVISIEGNDIASNTPWIMYSKSLLVMPIPRTESWLLESCLIPWVHFVPINETMDDLEEKLKWCNENDDKCQQIVKNASEYISDFLNPEEEKKLATLVIKNYFDRLTFVCNKDLRSRFGHLVEGKKNVVFE